MHSRRVFALYILISTVIFVNSGFAQEEVSSPEGSVWSQFKLGSNDSPDACLDEKLLPIQAGPFDIGGFIRYNFTHKDWDNASPHGEFQFDVVGVNVDLKNTGALSGSFQYRYYEPKDGGDYYYHFMHHGWLGYDLSDEDTVTVGVHQVPFGVTPFASHNWFFQLPYYVGLEDDYDLGVKYRKQSGNWTHELAYYLCDEGQYFGESRDSSRYSYDVVKSSASYGSEEANNEERNQLNYRIAYNFEHNENWHSELGASLQYSQIHNVANGEDGNHYAAAVHVNSNMGPYNLKAEVMRYEYSLKNSDNEGDGSYVVMGAYDYPYRVASRANIYVAGISRSFDVNWGPFTDITVYNDYSIMIKDHAGFDDTQHIVGKNQPWAGHSWNDSLASGDANDKSWNTRFNVNFGYYF